MVVRGLCLLPRTGCSGAAAGTAAPGTGRSANRYDYYQGTRECSFGFRLAMNEGTEGEGEGEGEGGGDTIWYVDIDNASGTEDGQTWATAYQFHPSRRGCRIGRWRRRNLGRRRDLHRNTTDPVLSMAENVHLYGGFAGTETAREQRNWTAHITAIDGENSRRCVNGVDKRHTGRFYHHPRKCYFWRRDV